MYMDEEGPIKPVKILDEICPRIPVHLVLGGVPDLIPRHVHDLLVDSKSSRDFASVKILPGVGHLVRVCMAHGFLLIHLLIGTPRKS